MVINQVQIKQKHNHVARENELAGFEFITDEATWWRMKNTSSSLIMEPPKTTCQPQTLENCGLFYRGNMRTRWMVPQDRMLVSCLLSLPSSAALLLTSSQSAWQHQADFSESVFMRISEVIHLIRQSLLWARRNTHDVFCVKTRKQTSMYKVCRISLLSCQNLSFVGLPHQFLCIFIQVFSYQ